MQIDMHYHGTYAMARAAGLKDDSARIIATAAQFVDDNAGKDIVEFDDGARVDLDATAHHAADAHNLDDADQRNVWVPFHFIPGNKGRGYTTRLLCVMDSDVAREMVEAALRTAIGAGESVSEQRYALALIGITAHVYADTFSHYGFSGVSSRRNKIEKGSIEFLNAPSALTRRLKAKESDFLERYGLDASARANVRRSLRDRIRSALRDGKAELAEKLSGGLGHGAALTYPDQPYLQWQFRYDDGRESGARDNPGTFEIGCERLHAMFRQLADARPDLAAAGHREWPEIERPVRRILRARDDDKAARAARWVAAKNELLPPGAARIPAYDAGRWHTERERLDGSTHSAAMLETEVYHFYRAAAHHRTYVLRDLLPRRGLVVN